LGVPSRIGIVSNIQWKQRLSKMAEFHEQEFNLRRENTPGEYPMNTR